MARRTARGFLIVTAIVAASTALAQPGDTPFEGRAMGNFRVACGEDMRRFCAGVMPGEGRIIQCLTNYRSQLSAACRADLAGAGSRMGAASGAYAYGPGRNPNGYGPGPNSYGYGPDPYGPDGYNAGPNANAYGRGFPQEYPPEPNRSEYGPRRDPRGYAAGDAPSSGPGESSGSIVTKDGRTRTYVLHLPAGYAPNKSYPLVLLFHGGYGSGAHFLAMTQFGAKADKEGFIVVAPDGIDRHWNEGKGTGNGTIDDVGFVRQLIRNLESRLAIDQKRIYATGFSNGGEFASRLGCELSDTLAAIGSAAGPLAANLLASCSPGAIAVIGIQGAADPLAPLAGGESGGGFAGAKGGAVASTAQTMKLWATADRCNVNPNVANIPPSVNDGTRVVKYSYSGCAAGTSVVYYVVQGMGHDWPPEQGALARRMNSSTSHNINATDAMWAFFNAHSR